MIVTCVNCKKKFNIESNLIPENGRLLQCNSCNHKWFFKKEIINIIENSNNDFKIDIKDKISNKKLPLENIELLDRNSDSAIPNEKKVIKKNYEKNYLGNDKIKVQTNNKKSYSFFKSIIVFIISFIAIIIILDTFQTSIGKIVPNIEFKLYNLYETINDILLFLKDLI